MSRSHTAHQQQAVVVVSGLPRSGTSLMMQMLEAGDLPLLTDAKRQPDTHNPKGYYELEQVKALHRGEASWLAKAHGKAVKIISNHLLHLPDTTPYKIIFMRRHMAEIVNSQAVMREETENFNAENLTEHYKQHLVTLNRWMQTQPNMDVLYVDYNLLLIAPEQYTGAIGLFLGQPLHQEHMVKVIDPDLYRQRSG